MSDMPAVEWMIQVVEPADDPAQAAAMLDALRTQDGFRGGRVLPKSRDGRPDRVQAFFTDTPDATWLPDGMRRVIILPGQAKTLGIEGARAV